MATGNTVIERRSRAWVVALSLFGAAHGCAYHPADFTDASPVTEVHDGRPIPVPVRTGGSDVLRYSEGYIRRALISSLDPQRTPEALDVNALDEVPASSWFVPGRHPTLDGYKIDGPPEPPFHDVEAPVGGLKNIARFIVDARGLTYELVPDEKYRSGLRPAAGAIASRIVYALGYYVAESYPITVGNRERVLAVRWPAARGEASREPAIDLGPTRPSSTRTDDPNDVVSHDDRRTMRAFSLVGAFIGLDDVRPLVFRDEYVGIRGKGFVQHQIVTLDDALGASAVAKALADVDRDRPSHNAWVNLGTFGFSPKERADAAATPSASVGLFVESIDPKSFHFSVPFPPADRALPTDLYWIAKRMMRITHARITEAVRSAGIETRATDYLDRVLLTRRNLCAAYAMKLVTPLELTRIEAGRKATKKIKMPYFAIELEDQAIAAGFARAADSQYHFSFLDEDGDRIGERYVAKPKGKVLRFGVPSSLLDERSYLIVRVRVEREGKLAPRQMEIHLAGTSKKPVLRGIRH